MTARPAMLATYVGAACVFVAAVSWLGSIALESMTGGRGARSETFPWLAIGSAVIAIAWIVWRLGRSPVAGTQAPDRPRVAQKARPSPSSKQFEGILFISYRRESTSDITGRIYDRCVQRFGRERVFKDVDSIPLGVDFRVHLSGAVAKCRVLLAIIGPGWTASDRGAGSGILMPDDFVRIEVEAAMERRIPIFPILVQGAQMPKAEDLPPSLKDLPFRNALQVRPDPDFHDDVDKLMRALRPHMKGIQRRS